MIVVGVPQAMERNGVVTLTGFDVASIESDWTTRKRAGKGQALALRDGLLFAGDKPVMTTWLDWIDYWAVDFDFSGTFRSVWQDFRTRKERTIGVSTPPHETGCEIMVQVVDIFANEHRTAALRASSGGA